MNGKTYKKIDKNSFISIVEFRTQIKDLFRKNYVGERIMDTLLQIFVFESDICIELFHYRL